MKRTLTLIALLLTLAANTQPLHVMTFNIRLDTPNDSLNAWPYRKDMLASQILFHDIHILGVQEALHRQMKDLEARLPRYRYTGRGRDDGETKGEYSAIFFDTARLKLLKSETFWLSLTPDVPGSKSWDAAITRVVTWGKFRDRKTKKEFFVFNTHFDHLGKEARRESAKLLLKKVSDIAGNMPVILMGDFNARPADEPIRILMDTSSHFHFSNAKILSREPHYGPHGTFNGFRNKEVDDQPIDYIMLRGKWKVLKHATLSQTWQGRFASDHFAVMAILAGK